MNPDAKQERIRVSLSIDPGAPAYALLAACGSLAERRAAAMGMLNVHAAAVAAGLAGMPSSFGASPVHTDAPPARAQQAPPARARTIRVDQGLSPATSTAPTYSRAKSTSLSSVLDPSDL